MWQACNRATESLSKANGWLGIEAPTLLRLLYVGARQFGDMVKMTVRLWACGTLGLFYMASSHVSLTSTHPAPNGASFPPLKRYPTMKR